MTSVGERDLAPGAGVGSSTLDPGAPPIAIIDATAPIIPTSDSPPVQVRLPDLDIDVAVDPVGVGEGGQMEIPADAMRAGWYRYGPAPGQAGAAVVAAHAGSLLTPRGPFFDLRDAEPGMAVEITLADASTAVFEVVEVEEHGKDGLDLEPYFDRSGEARLVLITCGGVWDEQAQSYLSNIIVSARLDDA